MPRLEQEALTKARAPLVLEGFQSFPGPVFLHNDFDIDLKVTVFIKERSRILSVQSIHRELYRVLKPAFISKNLI
jgi:hypothetical protein